MRIIASMLLLIASFSAFSDRACTYELNEVGEWGWVCRG